MYKGIVVEETEKCYIIFTDQCEYVKITKDIKTQVGSEIYFTAEDVYIESKASMNRWVAIAASFMFIIILMSYNLYDPMVSNAVAVVSVDINPSMEFYIDESKRVQSIKPYNEEAEMLLSEEYIGMNVEQVINRVIDRAVELNYLSSQNNSVFIAGGALNEENEIRLTDEINKILEDYESSNINITYVEVSTEFIMSKESKEESIGIIAKNEIKNNPATIEVTTMMNNFDIAGKWQDDEKKIEKEIEQQEKKAEEEIEQQGKKAEKEIEQQEKKAEKEIEQEEKKVEKEIEQEEKKAEKEIEQEEKKAEKEIEQEEKKAEKEIEQEEKKAEKEVEQEEKKAEKEIEQQEKKTEKDLEREEKKAEKEIEQERKNQKKK